MAEPEFVAPLKKAMAAHQQNDIAAARSGYENVLSMHPGQPDALYYLGVIEHAEGRLERAVSHMSESFNRAPRAEVGYNLSRVLTQLGKTAEVSRLLQAVLTIEPQHANAAFDLGLLLRNSNQQTEAIKIFRICLASPVHAAGAMMNIGLCHQDIGELDAAREWYIKSLDLRPDHAEAIAQIAFVTKFTHADDAHILRMKAALDAAKSDSDRCVLAFALGKALDDAKDHKQAFGYYEIGNAIKRQQAPFSLETTRNTLLAMLDFFRPDFLQHAATSSVAGSERMIFVLGMPRSGTSLIEQIIASHSEVYGVGELDTLQNLFRKEAGGRITDLAQATLDRMATQYLNEIGQQAPQNARYVVDKALQNSHFIPIIAQILPQAKFIYCKRNAMDNCVAIYRQNFIGHYPYAYDLSDTGAYYTLHETLINRFCEIMPSDRLYVAHYEALVDNPQEEIAKLLEFCKLDWQDGCMQFHKTDRAVKTASAAQVRSPIYRSSVNSWQRYGDKLHPLKHALGMDD
jgi:tetratricopeptide (TPR) repeat protein